MTWNPRRTTGRADPVALVGAWLKISALHVTTALRAPTQLVCQPLHAQLPARSVLKMKRVDPSQLCISATVGLVMPAGLKGRASASAARSGLARAWWISSGFVAPSTRMGPPLTECPGRCRVCERVRAWSPTGQTQPRAAWNACSRDDGNSGAASGADQGVEGCGAFQERLATSASKATGTCTTKETSGPSPRRAMTVPTRRPGLEGQVTTATPCAPCGAEPGWLSGNRS